VVADTQDLRTSYKLGVGDMTVDLRQVQIGPGETHVAARVDVGNLQVFVPDGVALSIRGDAQLGQVDILGRTSEGRNVDTSVEQPGLRVLVLDAHVGVGKLSVMRAVP
jgi:predicted membrane protein